MFGLMGALFVLTQFMQFELGYTPLQAGVRILPAAAAIVIVAPLSSVARAQARRQVDRHGRAAGGRSRAVEISGASTDHHLRRHGERA